MSHEVELVLALDPRDVRRLLRHPALVEGRDGPPRRRRLRAVYYDTPELDLAASRLALRVRREGRRWVQAIKGPGRVSGGLHRRIELEACVAGLEPEIERVGDPRLARVLRRHAARLVPVFVTDFLRLSWTLSLADGTRIACGLDRGEVRAGRRRRALCELELELQAGRPERLRDLARELGESLALRPQELSKAARGYALLR